MNKSLLLCVLAAVAAFPQAQTPLTITQSAGSATGELRMQERRTNGTNYVGIKSPQSVAANIVWALPIADGTANQCLSTDGAGQWGWRTCSGASVDLLTTDYDWYQTPGVSLTAATPATVTLTPCPVGVAPYIAHYSTRIAGGTGAAETVLITAVTGSGSTCDVEFTPANNHTGSWTIGSASDGIQEAVNYSIANAGHRVFIPQGVSTPDPVAPGEESTIYVQGAVTIAGANQSINGGSEIALNHDGQWAIIVTTGATNWPVHFEKFAIQGTGLTTGGGIKITASSGHNLVSKVKDMQLYTLPVGLWCEKCAAVEISGNFFWGFTDAGIRMENTYDTDAGDQTITNNQFQVITFMGDPPCTAIAIDWLSAGGAKIANNKFNLQGAGINMSLSAASIITTITGNSFDNQKLYSVKLRGTTGFVGAAIVGNVVTGAGDASYIAFDIGDNTTDVLSNIVVADNAMQAGGTGIKVGDAANVSISGNVLGSFTTAIDIKSTASGVALGKNTCYSVTTCYAVDAAADVRSTSPVFASGYGGWAASGTNIKSIAEFAPPASGEVNNAVLFQTNTTGTNSQRGIWWDTAANMHFARFSSNRSTTHTNDLKLEADGDAHFSYKVGVGRSPVTELDVNGVSRVYDGTIDLRFQVGSGAAYMGTNSNHPLLFTQDAAVRLYLSNSALLPNPSAGDTFNIGDPTIRFLGTYSKIFDTVKSAGTGDYMQTRKLQLYDNTGSSTAASYWDLNVVMSGVGAFQNSYFYLRDNAGNTVWRADKIASGSPVATTTIYTDLLPDSTANARDLGKTGQRWDEINGASLSLTSGADIGGNLSAAVINATGSPAYRVAGTTVIDASRNLSNIGTAGFGGLVTASAGLTVTGGTSTFEEIRFGTGSTYSIGATGARALRVFTQGITTGGPSYWESGSDFIMRSGSVMTLEFGTPGAGKVLTSDAAGVATWQAPGSSKWTAGTGTNIYRSAGNVGIGDSSPQGLLEVFSATNVGTSPLISIRSNYATSGNFGGIRFGDQSQTSLYQKGAIYYESVATSARGKIHIALEATDTSASVGLSDARLTVTQSGIEVPGAANITGNLSAAVINATGSPAYRVSGTTVINASRDATFVGLTTSGAVSLAGSTISAGSTFSSDLIATTNSTYALGSNAVRWLAYLNTVNINGTVTLNGSITGDVLFTANNTYIIGNGTNYLNNIHSATVTTYGQVKPASGVTTADLGASTTPFRKLWTGDISFTGTMTPPSGSAFTGTKTVRASGGASDCTLTFSAGIMTGGTC